MSLFIAQLDKLYSEFRFKILPNSSKNIRVYAYKSAYFYNVDIVIVQEGFKDDAERIRSELQRSGYACTIRQYESIDDATASLFKGFFDYNNAVQNGLFAYQNYTDKITEFIGGKYQYLPSSFYNYYNNQKGDGSIANKVIQDLMRPGPQIAIIEAAAGFGKTSTSYEVLSELIKADQPNIIPLIAELSRHRQATIFKYVLFEEIDKKFTGINLDLVITFIKKGWIPLIIDGFDELLRSKQKSDGTFEEAEPMLATIKELLEGEAKILLTTRRTALYGDVDMFSFLDQKLSNDKWTLTRYVLEPPTIQEWLSPYKVGLLEKNGLDISQIANPVILAFLRSLSDDVFESTAKNIENIVATYFDKLLEREKSRQNLQMSNEEQSQIIESICAYLTEQDLSYDEQVEIEKVILNRNITLLEEVSSRYGVKEKESIEDLATRLSSHAFLDRKGEFETLVGFVNDFVFGTYIGKNIMQSNEWFGTERFIDMTLVAYKVRSAELRKKVWNGLSSVYNLLNVQRKVETDLILLGSIQSGIDGEIISDCHFSECICANGVKLSNVVFNNCVFENLTLSEECLENINFINCRLSNVSLKGQPEVFTSGCQQYGTNVIDKINEYMHYEIVADTVEVREVNYERHVLEKFWPAGRARFATNRAETTLKMGLGAEDIPKVEKAISSLLDRKILYTGKGMTSIGLNIKMINEIKQILNR